MAQKHHHSRLFSYKKMYLPVGLEVESFTTAMAANIGILKKYHLTIARNLRSTFRVTYNNSLLSFDVNEYFDLALPLVICLSPIEYYNSTNGSYATFLSLFRDRFGIFYNRITGV